MQRHARASTDRDALDSRASQRREGVVSGLAVAAVAIAALLAAVMHTRPEGRSDGPRLALAAAAVVQAPPLAGRSEVVAACAECGVVEAVVPLVRSTTESVTGWQLRIRMDDGSLRTVEQHGALAAGSRVTVAGGSIRVLPNRAGPG